MPIALKPFDPSREFVAQTSFRAGGKVWAKGSPFDKSFVNGRVLEQLYDQCRIAYGAEKPVKPQPLGKALSRFAKMVRATTGHKLAGDLSPTEAHDVALAATGKAAAAPEGDAVTAAADREGLVKKLVNGNTLDELQRKASGLKGASKTATKTELAGLIVDAGRVDGTA